MANLNNIIEKVPELINGGIGALQNLGNSAKADISKISVPNPQLPTSGVPSEKDLLSAKDKLKDLGAGIDIPKKPDMPKIPNFKKVSFKPTPEFKQKEAPEPNIFKNKSSKTPPPPPPPSPKSSQPLGYTYEIVTKGKNNNILVYIGDNPIGQLKGALPEEKLKAGFIELNKNDYPGIENMTKK
jgi:hypothetical protein